MECTKCGHPEDRHTYAGTACALSDCACLEFMGADTETRLINQTDVDAVLAELARPCPSAEAGDPTDEPTASPLRAADGYFYHEYLMGPECYGYIDHWGGEAFVTDQYLPEFMQLRVSPEMRVCIRTHQPGKLVAFIKRPTGDFFCIAFTQIPPL